VAEHKETPPQTGAKKPDEKKNINVTEEDLKDVSGGLNPQPLPPEPPHGDPARRGTKT
jgi:hypothetical protein